MALLVEPNFLSSPRFIRVARRVRAVRSLTLNISATVADVIFPLDETSCIILTSPSFMSRGQAHTEDTCVKNPFISILAGGRSWFFSWVIANLIPVPQPSMSPISLKARAITGLRSTDIEVDPNMLSS